MEGGLESHGIKLMVVGAMWPNGPVRTRRGSQLAHTHTHTVCHKVTRVYRHTRTHTRTVGLRSNGVIQHRDPKTQGTTRLGSDSGGGGSQPNGTDPDSAGPFIFTCLKILKRTQPATSKDLASCFAYICVLCVCECGCAFGCSFDNEHWAKKFALLYIYTYVHAPYDCVCVCVLVCAAVLLGGRVQEFGSVRFRFISWTVVSLTLKRAYTTRMSPSIYPMYTHTHTHVYIRVCVCFAAPPNAELDLYVYNKST